VAQWVLEHGTKAGRGTETLPAAQALYIPLTASRGTIGVLGLFSTGEKESTDPERVYFIEALASQTALVLERAILVREAQEAQLRAETERLRDSLLSSVSHDLRTPLGTITGGASTMRIHRAELGERVAAVDRSGKSQALNRLCGVPKNMSRSRRRGQAARLADR
jgi:two-component system sensor histidine kinase KdpD